jgi:hypothetical protein
MSPARAGAVPGPVSLLEDASEWRRMDLHFVPKLRDDGRKLQDHHSGLQAARQALQRPDPPARE